MTDQLRQAALKQALNCIKRLNKHGWILADHEDEVYSAIIALKAALKQQPVQDPVAWMVKLGEVTCYQHHADSKHASVPLYTAPPLPVQEPVAWELEEYDAGLLSNYGGGNVEWWQDYIRVELSRAYDHYQSQTITPSLPAPPVQWPVACRFCHSEKGCWAWQCYHCGEIDDVQQPAAQPVQEPVAWTTMPEADDWDFVSGSKDPTGKLEGKWFPLYTAPPAVERPWVGLTPEEVLDLFDVNNVYGSKWIEFARTVEVKLKERNK